MTISPNILGIICSIIGFVIIIQLGIIGFFIKSFINKTERAITRLFEQIADHNVRINVLEEHCKMQHDEACDLPVRANQYKELYGTK